MMICCELCGSMSLSHWRWFYTWSC